MLAYVTFQAVKNVSFSLKKELHYRHRVHSVLVDGNIEAFKLE